jgi:uncharacterized lipoprotein NlpE involved in copper resistance
MARGLHRHMLLAAAIALALTSLAGCGARADSATSSGSTVSSAASGTPSATASAPATAAATAASPAVSPKRLSASDAKAIDAELAAIESELDRMSVPDDGDFGGISSGLK